MSISFRGLYIDKDQLENYRAGAAGLGAKKMQVAASATKTGVTSVASTLASAAPKTGEWISLSSLWTSFWNLFSSSSKATDIPSMEKRLGEIAARDKYIWFYDEKQNPLTSCFGNFHPCKIKIWGLEFVCAEAAFQAAKFYPNKKLVASFCKLNGDEAFQHAKQLTAKWSPKKWAAWQKKNVQVMDKVVMAKFSQNPDLKRLLLATKDAHLIEHTARDSFWGDGGDGTGANELGKVLMRTRKALGGTGFKPQPKNYNPKILGR